MTLEDAITVARRTLFNYGGLMLINGQMYPQNGRDEDAVKRAEAYNLLAKHHRDIAKALPISEEDDDATG